MLLSSVCPGVGRWEARGNADAAGRSSCLSGNNGAFANRPLHRSLPAAQENPRQASRVGVGQLIQWRSMPAEGRIKGIVIRRGLAVRQRRRFLGWFCSPCVAGPLSLWLANLMILSPKSGNVPELFSPLTWSNLD